jgi:hypothetical protein
MRNIIKFCVVASVILLPVNAYSDQEGGPLAYATTSADGKYIFVMLVPGRASIGDVPVVEGRLIVGHISGADYPTSGLYNNDASNTQVWPVNWYARSVIVPSDGIHLVRRGPWAKSLSDEAYSFYANGKELRSYRIRDLVDTSLFLEHSTSHFEWEETVRLDEPHHELVTAIYSKERFVFDYTSGEIISSRRPLRLVLVVCGAALVLMIGWMAVLLFGWAKPKQPKFNLP